MSEEHENKASETTKDWTSRLFAPDALRGLIIVLMALDHASFLVAQKHPSGEYWGGAFPTYDEPLVFLTRFVTHFCAPGFFLLMGLGMVLFACSREERGWTRWQTIGHFVVRGVVLIALQLLVVNRAWELATGGWSIQIYLGVLYALGGAMIVGSLLLWLKPAYLLLLTAVLLLLPELLIPAPNLWGQGLSVPEVALFVPGGIVQPKGQVLLWSNYQTLPWLGLATLGMVFGHWLADDPQKAYGRAWKLGLAFLLAFLLVRTLDGFGNIRPRMGDGWIDFLNVVKYPPSMAYTFMTTGVNLVLLWLFSRAGDWIRRFLWPLTVYGQAPLFFYVLHLFLYVAIGHLMTPRGTSLPAMYPLWLLGLLVLFPLCLGYRWLKRQYPARLVLRYL